ncbi:MAG: hypothetical protein ABI434_11400, partial [Burkholderiaceae bacterium]
PMATTFQAKSPKDSPQVKKASRCVWRVRVAGFRRLHSGRFMPTPNWPDYGDYGLAGLCRSLTADMGALRQDLAMDAAADIIGSMKSPEFYRRCPQELEAFAPRSVLLLAT